MSVNDEKKGKPTPEEVEAWVNGVHEGPCCGDRDDECETDSEK